MIKAVIFDCFGVLAIPDGSGELSKNTELLNYIKTLKPELKIGMLSNIAGDWVRQEFLNAAEQELFHDMVFSYEVGMEKPMPAVFEMACQRLGVTPEEAVMIDDIARYIDVAREVGLKGIIYQDLPQMQQELTTLLDAND